MGRQLDEAKIRIKFKMIRDLLATVTLSFNNEYEVRFNRLTLREDNSIWFQPPALVNSGWAKCFGVMDAKDWKKLEKRVIDQFRIELDEKIGEGLIPPAFLDRLTSSKEEAVTEKDWEEMEKQTT